VEVKEEKLNVTAEAQESIEAPQNTETESAAPEPPAGDGAPVQSKSEDAPQADETEAAPAAESEEQNRSEEKAAVEKPATPPKKLPSKKKVVRKLSIGQEMTGTITRVTNFGAFVDIGVGRDGLIHISELSGNRIDKVSDVVSKGQEVTVWIRSLDRERNRISLTMCKPPSVDISALQPDAKITGTVTRLVAYGAFVDIDTGREALLHVREMADDYVKNPGDIVSVGDEIEARIIKVDPRTRQVDLSIKEESAPEEAEILEEVEEEAVPTAMELALKEALATEGKEPHWVSKRRYERRKKETERREQDDILSRTLDDMHRQWDDGKAD
jgi:small subunit ribosomal protein S1